MTINLTKLKEAGHYSVTTSPALNVNSLCKPSWGSSSMNSGQPGSMLLVTHGKRGAHVPSQSTEVHFNVPYHWLHNYGVSSALGNALKCWLLLQRKLQIPAVHILHIKHGGNLGSESTALRVYVSPWLALCWALRLWILCFVLFCFTF